MNVQSASQQPLLELDLLKTLVAIAETGNFSSAAEAVFRTPSAISMQVKKIEDIVERPIFIRDSRSVSLTNDGELLLEHARRLLALNTQLMSQFIAPDIAGVVRLGAVDHTAETFIPPVLKRFNASHPGVTVDVTVENSSELAERIRDGGLDIAIVTCDSNTYSGLPVETVYRERLVWAGLRSGVAVEQKPLPISVWEEGCVWRKAAIESLAETKREYRVSFKSAHIAGQKAAIAADMAIAPLPFSSCGDNIVPIDAKYGLPELGEYNLGMIVARDSLPPVIAAADHLRASFASR